MIVRDIMTTKVITVAPDDTLAHAANLLRQHRFHHLPVVRPASITISEPPAPEKRKKVQVLEGLLTSQDIDMASALTQQGMADGVRPWQEQRVVEVMHRALLRVTPTTSIAAAAQILVERNLNYLPVVEYARIGQESRAILVGLVTRSDLLLAFSRAMGAYEPGMQLDIVLPVGDMTPLARTLTIASELHMHITSVMAAPLATGGVPEVATLRLSTINPTPLLRRLQEEGVKYVFGVSPVEDTSLVGGELHG